MAGFLDFLMDGNVVFMCFFYIFFLLCSPTSYFCDHISERGKDAAGGSILWPISDLLNAVVQKFRELVKNKI
jgi:hypothetical protein